MFKVDLRGRIYNLTLGKENVLMPLFDAVINSIQAIDAKKEIDSSLKGNIKIYVTRDNENFANQQKLKSLSQSEEEEEVKELVPIKSFRIYDNGIGFNQDNFNSFLNSDSTYKRHLGCKGIGRLLWLKAFNSVKVESAYQDNNNSKIRKFDFNLGLKELIKIENDELLEEYKDSYTIVSLEKIKSDYQENLSKQLKTIALKVVEHCLPNFLSGNAPSIELTDEDSNEYIHLNTIFEEEFKHKIKQTSFKIKDKEFNHVHFECRGREYDKHRVYYCAGDRIVCHDNVDKYPELKNKIRSQNNDFWYVAFVTSDLLDEKVNENRTAFLLPKKQDCQKKLSPTSLDKEIFIEDVKEKSLNLAYEYLDPLLKEIFEEKAKKLEDKIKTNYANLDYLLKNEETKREILSNLSLEEINNNCERKLYDYHTKTVIDRNCKAKSLLEKDINKINLEEYEEEYKNIMSEVSEANQAELASYVSHRKVILELFDKKLSIQSDGKYPKEDEVHSLIYPTKKDSNEVDFNQHNLWLIDERLSFHSYLASEKEFRSHKIIISDSQDRPDICIYNDDKNIPFQSIILVEFKRPEREDLKNKEHPVDQIYRYVNEIKDSAKRDYKGRTIKTTSQTRFYAYIICDLIDEKFIRQCKERYCHLTPDGMGLYSFNPETKVYIEIMNFDKLLQDSKKRNAVLFDKLGLH